MSEIIGQVERVYIAPIVAVPAATVDGYPPNELRIGMSGLSAHGVETLSFAVRPTGEASQAISATQLSGVQVDIQHDRLELRHPEAGVMAVPTAANHRHHYDQEVNRYLQAIVGEAVELAGPARHIARDPLNRRHAADTLDRYGVLRVAVTPDATGLLYETSVPQPLIPGVDVVITGIGEAVSVGRHLIVRQPSLERYDDFSGWVVGAYDVAIGEQPVRVADVQYHNNLEFGRRLAVTGKVHAESRL